MASLEDKIVFNFKEAVDEFIRQGFSLTEDKRLILNNLEVIFKRIGSEMWRTSVIDRSYSAD